MVTNEAVALCLDLGLLASSIKQINVMPEPIGCRQTAAIDRGTIMRFPLLAMSLALTALLSQGEARAATSAEERCVLLNAVTISPTAIGLPTNGARVTAAQFVQAAGSGPTAVAEHCKVVAAIRPLDPSAPEIRFAVALPSQWNGKTLMLGGGGFDGSIPNVVGQQTVGPIDRPPPVSQGYAVFGSDSGHQGSTANVPFANVDGSFALNDEALANYAGDALKKARDAAMQIIVRRYERTPTRNVSVVGTASGDA